MSEHIIAAAMQYLGEYGQFLEDYDPYVEHGDKMISPEAFIRAKIMNSIDSAVSYAMEYAETNRGI